MNLTILYEDDSLIVCVKPAGIASQDERGFQPAFTDLLKHHLMKQNGKKGVPYLGIVHRLDKPVGGVMVYAKSKEAAASLSSQIANHQIKKHYYAILTKAPDKTSAVLTDYLVQDKKNNCSFVADASHPEAKQAELSYQILEQISFQEKTLSLADITLKTGRHHQIRVQFSHLGCPLYGDTKYHTSFDEASSPGQGRHTNIGLYSYCLEFMHPGSKKIMTFSHIPSDGIWRLFPSLSNSETVDTPHS